MLAKPALPSLNFGHPLAQGFIAGWPFWEGNGLLAHDALNRGWDGTLTTGGASGLPFWTGGSWGSSLRFNSSDRRVVIPQFIKTFAPPLSVIIAGSCITQPAKSTYRSPFFFRGTTNFFGISCGNGSAAGRFSCQWNGSSAEFDAATGVDIASGDDFVLAMVLTPTLESLYGWFSSTGGIKTWSLAGTYNSKDFSGVEWDIGNDSGALTARWWPGNIDCVTIVQRAINLNEFAQFIQDMFVIYRRRSRWWETVVGTAPVYIPRPHRGTVFIDRVRRI